MPRTIRIGVTLAATLVGLFALHVQINLGGWPRFLGRLRHGGAVRGELVVGFLPVT